MRSLIQKNGKNHVKDVSETTETIGEEVNRMTRFVVVFFAFLGVVFMALLIASIAEAIATAIRRKRKEYEYKHRFDKSPTAECYCVDCWYRDSENSKCRRYQLYVADDWFCKDAMPD